MRIASDLDDCILNTASEVLKHINNRLNTNYRKEDITDYHFSSIIGSSESRQEVVEECTEETLCKTRKIPFVYGSISMLNWLASTYEENVYILTRRPRRFFEMTYDVLADTGLDYFYLYANHPDDSFYTSKADRINRDAIEVMIEDNPEEIEEIYNKTQCRILVMDQPWNQHIKEDNRITIVKNWAEIRNILTLM